MNSFAAKVEELVAEVLTDPEIPLLVDPKPTTVNLDIFKPVPWKKEIPLTLPAGGPGTRHTVEGVSSNGEEFSLVYEHEGYWRAESTFTLLLHSQFRETLPVWKMAVCARFCDEVIKARDERTADEVYSKVFGGAIAGLRERRKKGDREVYLRAPYWVENGFTYVSNISGGNWRQFSGSELVRRDGQVVWSSDIHGQLIVPISFPID